MGYNEELTGTPPGTEVPQELLEEMLWFFRVEDATPWTGSMFALVVVVVVISIVFLGRNIQANRNQKRLPPEKQTPEVLYLAEARNKDDDNLTTLRETLLSEKPKLAQVEMEVKDSDVPPAILPDPREPES
ncbi:organic solute transporter subunit beta [Balaenoptera ricei]|uniref:organic solute transporter subunit beta n=1 Tax=Balaenoptera ricei TaxID=2746895 RepID=UPI0028BEFE89|nr:organic solute transporter subunit beta [Balaenoptera ricei]XP_059769008.1 organic solute transporter subunit beta [Balaenoptera ricei]XP_059769009.1 organic solute transporter subunit beta [Balaenoptera ricei]XP_059769010.1 organic solute transporter subunit beta [Balaenoptera ricei]XP_059769011.1 organic solute transporter subunit beta [Balaenoptera ricei]